MPNLLVWHKDNRNPSITEQLTTGGGTPVDLSSSTVKFKMRAVNSSTLVVDAAAIIVGTPTEGNVRYDWAAVDVDTAGQYLVWWEVTTTTKTQDMGEAVIEIRAHEPLANAYVELEQFKRTAELTGTSFADNDIQAAILAAARAVDQACNRRFWLDEDDTSVRYFQPANGALCVLDDVVVVNTFEVDNGGDGTYDTWTVNTDYLLFPVNAAADGYPYTRAQPTPYSGRYFVPLPRAVKVTAQFGWAAVPAAISEATTVLASRLLKRAREAPFGIVTIGIDVGAASRMAVNDPDVQFLISPYRRLWA